jgi:hypothetical protein
VHGNYYGTGRRAINDLRQAGFDVILTIDVQGEQQVRRFFPEAVDRLYSATILSGRWLSEWVVAVIQKMPPSGSALRNAVDEVGPVPPIRLCRHQ